LIVLQVDNVDAVCKKLSDRGVAFINEPMDMAGWGGRVAHFRDPEDNLIELYAELPKDKWSDDLIEESNDY
jgi:predicted enzyme related to lactoylglutathione lyase